MFRSLRLKRQPQTEIHTPGSISREELSRDATRAIPLRRLNELPENVKKRVYRLLLPASLLTRLSINPITWKGPKGETCVHLVAHEGSESTSISVRDPYGREDECLILDIADNAFNGIELNLLVINDPESERFFTDQDVHGAANLFGATRRNLEEEARAVQAGLAPGQVRKALGVSGEIIRQLDVFLSTLGHQSYSLEPMTYGSAWVFERRGFAYIRGHKLMDDIHAQFQPGGLLYQALDGSNLFRRPESWCTVRGRAWAIHDGILEVMGTSWNGLRMIKQIGRNAGVVTFPNAEY